MPVCGIRHSSAQGLYFTWQSWRCWISILYLSSTVLDTFFTIYQVMNEMLDVRNVEPIVFHGGILLASWQFFGLAKKWPQLMRRWDRVEHLLPMYDNWKQRERLARQIQRVAFVLIGLSLMEHLLSIISAVYYDYCPRRRDPIESYLYKASYQLFFVFPYSHWMGCLGKIQNILLTFGWSFMDIFVIMISMGLSELFARLTQSLERRADQAMPEAYWTSQRTQYRAIVNLIYQVDNAISGIILISFGNNLYFVCLNFLKSIKSMPSMAHTVYFFFSLAFLLGRSIAVVIVVSSVNDRSQEPLRLLKLVPQRAFHVEVERFASELAKDVVALSGLKFFNVTRKLFLTVAGTIVTYELVLIQFHEDKKPWDCGALNVD
ncbi:LOW QUALITY PROTEIN: gustatory receptor 5a for trehalose [Drosophila tropicalis]|uniref:LOW QUALITY PROTEIN: gustatory receptor 5a for trehalose n=1 Tax=Drosophila tropicalis TaxID=46794 RepID=UPI0035ABAF7F